MARSPFLLSLCSSSDQKRYQCARQHPSTPTPGGGLYLSTFIPWAEITGELEEGSWYLDQEATTPEGNQRALLYTL